MEKINIIIIVMKICSISNHINNVFPGIWRKIKLLPATFIGAEFAIKKCKRFTKSILVASAIDVISEFFVSFSVFKITKKKVEIHHKQ